MKKIPVRHIPPASFGIRDLQDVLAGNDMVQELHRHDFYYLLAVKEGTGHHEIDFTPYRIGHHAIFFLRPGQVHQLHLGKNSTGYMMQFNPAYYVPASPTTAQQFHEAAHTNHYHPDTAQSKKLFSLLADILQENTRQQPGYLPIIAATLDIFFITLTRSDVTQANNHHSYMQEQLQTFSTLLETHISQHKQVAQYASLLHLSPYQLNTITKTLLGKTASQMINEYILLEAKRYLLATSNQVNQVADLLGYEDVSYFIRFFKKHTGQSPEAFRHHFK